MVGPKLRWVRYELTLPKEHPLWAFALATPAAAVDPTVGRLTIDLPDLAAWPAPADKIGLLLDNAAEIEHDLMVQYLYAAYSLLSPSAVTDPDQKAALQSWPGTIRKIAREEMGHLMTVQNLRLFVGLPPSFRRDNFPAVDGLFPFETHLAPLTQRILAEYVVAESPTDETGIDDIIDLATGGGTVVNHVGVLYALIGVVLASSLDEIEQDATSGEFWDVMVRQIAYLAYEQNPPSSQWHLPATAFVPSSLSQQGPTDDWNQGQTNIEVFTLQTRQDAKQAIKQIGLQGEGPGQPADTSSHFSRFLSIYRGNAILPFPATGDWLPTIDVPTDPFVSDDIFNPSAISNPATQPWATLADLRYAILLGFLEEYLRANPVAPRAFLRKECFAEMTGCLQPLSKKLVTMPCATSGSGKAALPFTCPSYGFPLPDDPTARKQVHRQRLQDAIQLEQDLLASGDDPLLDAMLTADQQSLLQFP